MLVSHLLPLGLPQFLHLYRGMKVIHTALPDLLCIQLGKGERALFLFRPSPRGDREAHVLKAWL